MIQQAVIHDFLAKASHVAFIAFPNAFVRVTAADAVLCAEVIGQNFLDKHENSENPIKAGR
jgi:hypothetical protein